MTSPFEKKWLIGAADELAAARTWLQQNLDDTSWRLELLGLEVGTAAGARIAVRCAFQHEGDSARFSQDYLVEHSASAQVPVMPPPPPPETEADAAFAEGARHILEGPEPISAGRLHFLGLDKVRAHFGDAWPKLASRAEALVRRAIERRLSPQDVYRKTADLNFIVLFANLSSRESELKCTIIAEEITRMLVGDEMGAGMLSVKTIAADVNGPETLRKLGPSLDVAQVIEAEVEVERLRRDAPPPPALDAAASSDPLSDIQFGYRPIWDVKRSAIANFFLQPRKSPCLGQGRYGDTAVPGLENIELQRRFDRLIVDRVVADLQALHRQGRRLLVSFPVHFESISTPTRRGILLERWRTLPMACRQLGVFEIVGAPEGVPQGRLAEIINHLKIESRGVLIRVPLTTVLFRNISDTGVLAVGAEICSHSGPEERLIAAFRDFVAHAERARLVSYIHGLRSLSLTIGAICAGFAYVDGDPVSSISQRPEDAYRFGLEDLYAQGLRA